MMAAPVTNLAIDGSSRWVPERRRVGQTRVPRWRAAVATDRESASPRTRSMAGPLTRSAVLASPRQMVA